MISEREKQAALVVARLMDSVAAGDTEKNVRILKTCPTDLYPIVILLLAGTLHETEMHESGLEDVNVRLKDQLKRAWDEGTKFAEAYNVQRAKVQELRAIMEARTAAAPLRKVAA